MLHGFARDDDEEEVRVSIRVEPSLSGESRGGAAAMGRLPFQLAEHLVTFMGARELMALHEAAAGGGGALRDVRDAAESRSVWADRLRADYPREPLPAVGQPETAKVVYARARTRQVEEERLARRNMERQLQHMARQRLYLRFSAAYHFFQEFAVPCLAFPLLLAGVVLVVQRLDSGGAVGLGEMAPFLAFAAAGVLAASCACYAKAADEPVPFDDNVFDESEGFFKEAVELVVEAAGDTVAGGAASCAVFSMLPLQLVLICLRAAGVVSGSWFLVFLPWWIFAAALALSVFLEDMDMPPPAFAVVYLCGFSLPGLAFPLALCSYLDGGSGEGASLIDVMIPLWIWFGLMLLGVVAAFANEIAAGVATCFGWICCVGPLVAFQVMLVVMHDGTDISYTHAGIPIMVVLSVLSLFGMAAGTDALTERFG